MFKFILIMLPIGLHKGVLYMLCCLSYYTLFKKKILILVETFFLEYDVVMKQQTAHQIADVILNVTVIVTFIGLFFFTYGKTVEQKIVRKQSEFIADSLAKDIGMFIDSQTAAVIADGIQIQDQETLHQQDKQVE